MTSLKYKDKNGFWQELQVGTNVVANPIIAGTESELTGLQVGDAKYKMPAGGKLYVHSIHFYFNEFPSSCTIELYSSNGNAYTNIPEGLYIVYYEGLPLSGSNPGNGVCELKVDYTNGSKFNGVVTNGTEITQYYNTNVSFLSIKDTVTEI